MHNIRVMYEKWLSHNLHNSLVCARAKALLLLVSYFNFNKLLLFSNCLKMAVSTILCFTYLFHAFELWNFHNFLLHFDDGSFLSHLLRTHTLSAIKLNILSHLDLEIFSVDYGSVVNALCFDIRHPDSSAQRSVYS